MEKYARQLYEQGVVVVPLLSSEETGAYHRDFVDTLLHHTPELTNPRFNETTPADAAAGAKAKEDAKQSGKKRVAAVKTDNNNSKFVDGGFGALALPSSFHNPVVRRLRAEVATRTRPLFKELSKLMPTREEPLQLEQLIDRFSIRPVGTSTTAESWHRDQSPRWPGETPTNLDVVLGGWINLDLEGGVQRFSCQPSTHHVPRGATGFARMTDKEAREANAHKQVFEVPAGHWIVFYQNIVHEVFPTKAAYDSMRLFVGFRLTTSKQPLFIDAVNDAIVTKEFRGTELDLSDATDLDVERRKKRRTETTTPASSSPSASPWHTLVFEKQGVPPIPSGQRPPMYSSMSMAFRKRQLSKWATDELDARICVVNEKGECLPMRFCPSLKDAGFPMFPPYTADEIAIHTPQPL